MIKTKREPNLNRKYFVVSGADASEDHKSAAQEAKVPCLVLLFLVFTIPLAVWHVNLTAIEIKDFLAVSGLLIIGMMSASAVLKSGKITLQRPVLTIVTACYMAALAGSYYFNTSHCSLNYRALLPQTAGPAVFLSVISLCRFRDLQALIWAAVLAGTAAALNGILQYFELSPFLWRNQSLGSTFGHKSLFAHYLVMVFPTAVWLAVYSENKAKKLAAAACFGLMIIALGLSGSRAGILSLIIGFSVGAGMLLLRFLNPRIGLRYVLVITAVILAAGVFSLQNSDVRQLSFAAGMVKPIKHELQKRGNLRRIACVKAAWEIIRSHPIAGIGPGNFQVYHPANQTNKIVRDAPNTLFDHVENDYLEHWLEYGILPVLIFAGIMGWVFFMTVRGFYFCTTPKNQGLLLALCVSFSAGAVFNFFTTAGRFMSSAFFFWLFLGISVKVFSASESNQYLQLRIFSWQHSVFRFAPGILIGGVFYLISILVYANYASDIFFQQGHAMYRSSQGHFYYAKSLELNPKSVEAHYQRGFLLFHEKRYPEALKEYQAADLLAPNYENVVFNLASCYYRLRDWKNALFHAERAVYLFPEYLPALRMAAYCRYYLGDPAGALLRCRAILASWPDDEKMLSLTAKLAKIQEP